MKYLACFALALLVAGMTTDEAVYLYGVPTITIGFFTLLGVWGTFEDLINKIGRSL